MTTFGVFRHKAKILIEEPKKMNVKNLQSPNHNIMKLSENPQPFCTSFMSNAYCLH